MVRSSKKQVNDNKTISYLPWLTDELKQDVRKHFEPKYKRKLTENEVYTIADNLKEVIEAYLKMKWQQLNPKK
ncbi:MAG: hypothetical protein UT08_C0009G0019 [Candidatus Woesebacteria bacterium GW2011_GWB1_38_8]|uniref:Uncharacterized protein n=1 Tax=Candidatus Woesebacteria bacterium GW2011_GWB1_38_8 TaxID=1618570 RepID=A0A0G0LBG2_9BACT|nr:MAG: hypothetical protein UT08_C0009G0019 [Candidatus Woesebacteria bacterium GW2011_GWB1_38_8]